MKRWTCDFEGKQNEWRAEKGQAGAERARKTKSVDLTLVDEESRPSFAREIEDEIFEGKDRIRDAGMSSAKKDCCYQLQILDSQNSSYLFYFFLFNHSYLQEQFFTEILSWTEKDSLPFTENRLLLEYGSISSSS